MPFFLLSLKTSLQDEYPTSWYLHLYCDRGQGPENTEFLPFFRDKKTYTNHIDGKIGQNPVLELARTLISKREPTSSTSRHLPSFARMDRCFAHFFLQTIQVAIDGDSRWAHPSTDTVPSVPPSVVCLKTSLRKLDLA